MAKPKNTTDNIQPQTTDVSPDEGDQIADAPLIEPRARPTSEEIRAIAHQAAKELSAKELELLAGELLKKAGHAGKSPTGKHVAKHGFLRDILDEKTNKPIRVGPGEVLDDLSPEEIAHLTKHKAIEPEYA